MNYFTTFSQYEYVRPDFENAKELIRKSVDKIKNAGTKEAVRNVIFFSYSLTQHRPPDRERQAPARQKKEHGRPGGQGQVHRRMRPTTEIII